MMIKRKLKEWLKRYLPSEIIGTISAIVAASIARYFTPNLVIVAYAGTLGESIGFYGTVFIQRFIELSREKITNHKLVSIPSFIKIIGNMALEYGPAGLLDGFILRPYLLYIIPIILKNFILGILVGKIIGDITFYLLVILSYELKKYKVK